MQGGTKNQLFFGVITNPSKWPKLNGFHWGEITLLVGMTLEKNLFILEKIFTLEQKYYL